MKCEECGKPMKECEEYKAIMKQFEDFKDGKYDIYTLKELLEELETYEL